jgi:O-antigen ligase
MIGSVTLIGLTLSLAWTLVEWGGIPILPRLYSLLAIGLLAASYAIFTSTTRRAPAQKAWVIFSIAAIPCYMAFQLIPLPLALLQVLSPARGSLLAALGPVLPSASRATLSVNPPAATVFLFSAIAYLAVYLLVRELTWRFALSPWRTLLPLVFLGMLEAAYGMFQVSTTQDGRSSGTFTNWDHYAGFLEVILPLSIVLGLAFLRHANSGLTISPFKPTLLACATWCCSVMMFVAIVYSLSRTGFIVALLSLFLTVLLCIDLPRLSTKARCISLAVLGLLILSVFVFLPPEQLIERFAGFTSTGKLVLDARPSLWKATCSLISEFPLFGVGYGGFESTFMKYQNVAVALRINFAHNDYLQYLAEFGLVGYSLLILALTGVLIPLFSSIRRAHSPERRLVTIGCICSFVALALHSFFDFNSYVPATAITMAWILGTGSGNAIKL